MAETAKIAAVTVGRILYEKFIPEITAAPMEKLRAVVRKHSKLTMKTLNIYFKTSDLSKIICRNKKHLLPNTLHCIR